VDLIDLNLAHKNGVSEKIVVNTSEDFVWALLDLADRILAAAGEFAGVDFELRRNDEDDGYIVAVREKKPSFLEGETEYTPPKSDKLYDIRKTRVSPFTTVVSFKRNPQSSRYKRLAGVRGANIMNYFTRHLKFKIDRAELKFARYEATNIKGPPDRVIELLTTVYLARVKAKFMTIMTATSFQDWKYLASRDTGDDEFVEGDILRATGNLAGRGVGYVFKKASRGLGHGISHGFSTVGGGIETASGAIGARAVGAGANVFVSGVGEGVGDAVTGGTIEW
jgi:vacuolar protein sorting-associated protein 13A/C